MNKQKKKLIREALVAALPHLAMTSEEAFSEYTKDTYICYAINHACIMQKCTGAAANTARSYIQSMLDDCLTVTDYLKLRLGIDIDLLTEKNVQDYRKRWMLHMIEEFS